MPITVDAHDDPRDVIATAGTFLAAEPVRHNLVATLLQRCAAAGSPGRFWTARDGGAVVGVVFQWPATFAAAITPMPHDVVGAVVDTITDAGVPLPGVNGEAGVSAAFAGRWTDRTRTAARPVEALRLYEVETVVPAAAPGGCRPAGADDHELLTAWTDAFERESGALLSADAATIVTQRIAAGQLWIWDDGGPAAFLGLTAPFNGAARVGPVYTPPDRRGRGYGSALTAERSAHVRAGGDRCLLYADLANPTSNGIYRAIGYRAVAETLLYEFSDG